MNHTLGNYGTETPGFEVVFTVLFSGKQSLVEFYLANLQCGKQSRMQIGPFQKIKVTKFLFRLQSGFVQRCTLSGALSCLTNALI